MERNNFGLFLILGITLTSCVPGARVSVMVTDLPELALYAEYYNGSQDSYRIITEYDPEIKNDTLFQNRAPDLLISKNLSALNYRNHFSSLDFIFNRASQSPDSFYPNLLEMGKSQGAQILLPLSFNLPIIMGLKSSFPPEWSGLLVDTKEILQQAKSFNKPNKFPPSLGYSLRWSSSQLSDLLFRFKTEISFAEDGSLVWNEQNMGEVLKYLEKTRDINGGKFEDLFTSKYLPGHGFRLLKDHRVLYYPSTLLSFLNLPNDQAKELDFRYPSTENQIMAETDVVFLGIPNQAQSRGAAEDFSAWLFKKESQLSLLEYCQKNQIKTFGIAGGLSSLKDITEKHIPEKDPRLVGILPPTGTLTFPPALPAGWRKLTNEVIFPWVNRSLEDPETLGLKKTFQLWDQERKH